MNMVMRKLLRFQRDFHTIISKETIKPSVPTPSHLQTYNLSLLDQFSPRVHVPMVWFYRNHDHQSGSTAHHKANALKKSLSQSLTRYYPFAGKLSTTMPCVDCNDDGVVFVEARNERPLKTFLEKTEHDKTIYELVPDCVGGFNRFTSPLAVQISHFACGGVAIAVSLSHKIADACTLCTFVNHWATVTRFSSLDHEEVLSTSPHLIPSPSSTVIYPELEVFVDSTDLSMKTFVFPNWKLKKLKLKVQAMAETSEQVIPDPTRVEALNWLLHKCALAAAKETNTDSSDSYGLLHSVNMRNKMVEQLPETSVGNILLMVDFPTRNESEITPHALISQLRKGKTRLKSVKNLQAACELLLEKISAVESNEATQNAYNHYYFCSSACGFPVYRVNFGWGKPARVSLAAAGVMNRNSFVLMDTPKEDGIEALVTLSKEDMEIFEDDKDLLEFS